MVTRIALAILCLVAATLEAQSNPRVRVQTELGDIVIEVDARARRSRRPTS